MVASFGVTRGTAAFSLLELLMIIATLALLVCIFVPALARTAPASDVSVCLNNLRQLGASWLMYAEDNRGQLVYNGGTGDAAGSQSWVTGWLDFTSSDNTNTDMLVNHERYPFAAHLGPYLNKNPRAFKCPTDKSVSNIGGQRFPRVRSYSMSSQMGTGSRPSISPTLYWMYTRLNQVSRPSDIYVLLDEHENSINDGSFAVADLSSGQFIDFPGARHNGGSCFMFADGHSDLHQWKDRYTLQPIWQGTIPPPVVSTPYVDLGWLQHHATTRR